MPRLHQYKARDNFDVLTFILATLIAFQQTKPDLSLGDRPSGVWHLVRHTRLIVRPTKKEILYDFTTQPRLPPKIHKTLSEKTPSCVRRLIDYIPRTLDTIAPEKFNKLVEALGKGELELEIFESLDRVHEFDPEKKKIRLATRPIELLWAQSYSYFVWYSEELANVQPNGQQIDAHRKPTVHRALELLRWATEQTATPNREPWPRDAASPEPEPVDQPCAHVAQELSLIAVGFILHHELGHYRLRHQVGENIDQEREADYEAIDWIMGGIDYQSAEFQKGRWVRQSLCSTFSLKESTPGNTTASHILRTTTV